MSHSDKVERIVQGLSKEILSALDIETEQLEERSAQKIFNEHKRILDTNR